MATKANPSADPFSHVLAATHAHRAEHGCGAYSYANGTLLGALLIQSIENGLVIVNANPYLYPMVTSMVIFAAVILD